MGLEARDEIVPDDLSVVTARLETDAFADDDSRLGKRRQLECSIDRTIRFSMPANIVL